MNLKTQMSESYFMGTLLAAVGGYLDAYTYISRGGVFANAQTGNIVLLGVNLAERNFIKALSYLLPVLTFAVGVLISEIIKSKYKNNHKLHWRQIIVAAEAAILLCVAFIPTNIVANTLVSFICSLQVQTFRKINGNVLATTMCTGNLRTATESIFYGLKTKNKSFMNKSRQYYMIIMIFIIGAGIGALCTMIFKQKSVLFASAALLVCFTMMFIDTEKHEREEK
jgi:uncharacterized membrane protein YoaK (UPF0700 family)